MALGEVRSHRATTWAPVPWTLPALPGSPGRRAWESRRVANLIEMRCPTSYLLLYFNAMYGIALGLALRPRDEDPRSTVSPLQVMTVFKAAPEAVAVACSPGMGFVPTATVPYQAHESRYSRQGFIRTGPRAGDQMNQSGYSPSDSSSPHLLYPWALS